LSEKIHYSNCLCTVSSLGENGQNHDFDEKNNTIPAMSCSFVVNSQLPDIRAQQGCRNGVFKTSFLVFLAKNLKTSKVQISGFKSFFRKKTFKIKILDSQSQRKIVFQSNKL